MTPSESYLGDEIEKLENERTRLITKLDICRASLQLSTQEHQKLDSAYVELEGKLKITESLLESEQTILKLRTAERDKLTIENKQLKIDYAIYEACRIEMNRLYRQVGDIKNIVDLSDTDSHQMLLRDVRAIQSILK